MAPCPQCETRINKYLNICPFCNFVIRKEKNVFLPLIFSILGALLSSFALFGHYLTENVYVTITIVILGTVLTFSSLRPRFKKLQLVCLIWSGVCMIFLIIFNELYLFLTFFLFYAFIAIWSNLKRKNLAKYAKH